MATPHIGLGAPLMRACYRPKEGVPMNRLASILLAGAFLAGSAGMAFAATPSPAPATPAPHAMAHRAPAKGGTSAGNRMTQALNLLEAKGYGDFTNFKADGSNFTATVAQNGQHFAVLVNPDSGQVTRQG
jgi:hypothetical protein